MRNKKGIILMAVGALMILSALMLLIYNLVEDQKAGNISHEIMNELVSVIDESEDVNKSDTMPIVEIDGYEYVGYIYFPTLDKELPVMAEWSYEKLKKAPCRQQGSLSTQDLVIASHAFRKHFGNIKDLNVSDPVIFTNMNGVKYEYSVILKEVIEETNPEAILQPGYDLTLYTCNYVGDKRVVIRANMKK